MVRGYAASYDKPSLLNPNVRRISDIDHACHEGFGSLMAHSELWRSPGGEENAAALKVQFAAGFEAISEIDRIGHLLLFRASQNAVITQIDPMVGIALLRRAVTVFNGLRTLFEASAVDSGKALARVLFELSLHYRCLAYGAMHPTSLETPTHAEERERRARRYFVAAERRGLRARAVFLDPKWTTPPDADERDALRAELVSEINRLRTEFADEWVYFGDLTEATVLRRVGSRDEPQWFSDEFAPRKVNSIGQLAAAFAQEHEYDILYDAMSALVHPRGIRQDVTPGGSVLEVHHPHDPSWFQYLAWMSVHWQLLLLMTAAKCYAQRMIPQIQSLHLRLAASIRTLEPKDLPRLIT
jgi:hypothetical protein